MSMYRYNTPLNHRSSSKVKRWTPSQRAFRCLELFFFRSLSELPRTGSWLIHLSRPSSARPARTPSTLLFKNKKRNTSCIDYIEGKVIQYRLCVVKSVCTRLLFFEIAVPRVPYQVEVWSKPETPTLAQHSTQNLATHL